MRFTSIICLALVLLSQEVPAQVIWTPVTSDTWRNPPTQIVDSQLCLTSISCFGNNCTAAGRMQGGESKAFVRLAIYRSNDGGQSWSEQPFIASYNPKAANWGIRKVQQIDSLNVVAMAVEHGVILRTTDAGASWFAIHCPVSRELLDIHFSDPMTGVLACVGADSNLYTTTDGGKNWVYRSFTPVYSCYSYGSGKYSFHKYGHGPLYTTKDDFATVDSTDKFFNSETDPEYQYVIARIKYSTNDTLYAYGVYFSDSGPTSGASGLLMRSIDNGKSWQQPWIFDNTKLINVRYISSIDHDTIFAVGGDHFHYAYSTDRGSSWQLDTITMATPYAAERCYGVEMMPDGRPLAIFGSVWLPTNSVVVRGDYLPAKVEYTELIKYYSHFYPNPTTGFVNISTRYTLPVTVVDIFGREVIRDEHLSKDGKLSLDLSHVSAGMYNVIFDWMGRKFIAGKVVKVD